MALGGCPGLSSYITIMEKYRQVTNLCQFTDAPLRCLIRVKHIRLCLLEIELGEVSIVIGERGIVTTVSPVCTGDGPHRSVCTSSPSLLWCRGSCSFLIGLHVSFTYSQESQVPRHQENEEEKIIHYNHSMQWIMLDMVRYVQVID